MRRWLLGALLCLGCPPPPDPSCVAGPLRFERFLVPGERAEVTLGLAENCLNNDKPGFHTADEVTVEVRSPDDRAVAFEVSAPVRSPGTSAFTNTVVVSFTPDRSGPWRVNAKFEPAIGQSSLVIEAVEVRSDAGVRVLNMPFPVDCPQYAVTDLGAVVCAHFTSTGQELLTHRGQGLLGSAFAIEKNSVWRVMALNPVLVQRLVDNGTSLQAVNQREGIVGSFPVIQASGGDLWLLTDFDGSATDYRLVRAHPEEDGGLTVERTSGFLNFIGQGLSVGPEAVLVYGRSQSGGAQLVSIFPDGGLQRSALPPGLLAGADGQALWISKDNELTALRMRAGTLVQAALPLPNGVEGPRSQAFFWPSSPVVPKVGVLGPTVPRFDGTSIALELYDPGGDYQPISGATPTHVFAVSLDGKTLKIFDR